MLACEIIASACCVWVPVHLPVPTSSRVIFGSAAAVSSRPLVTTRLLTTISAHHAGIHDVHVHNGNQPTSCSGHHTFGADTASIPHDAVCFLHSVGGCVQPDVVNSFSIIGRRNGQFSTSPDSRAAGTLTAVVPDAQDPTSILTRSTLRSWLGVVTRGMDNIVVMMNLRGHVRGMHRPRGEHGRAGLMPV